MVKKPIFRARKNNWIFPLLIIGMGILHFSDYSYNIVSTSSWYLIIPLAFVFFGIGVFQHWKVKQID